MDFQRPSGGFVSCASVGEGERRRRCESQVRNSRSCAASACCECNREHCRSCRERHRLAGRAGDEGSAGTGRGKRDSERGSGSGVSDAGGSTRAEGSSERVRLVSDHAFFRRNGGDSGRSSGYSGSSAGAERIEAGRSRRGGGDCSVASIAGRSTRKGWSQGCVYHGAREDDPLWLLESNRSV